jgi:hypothetical protein
MTPEVLTAITMKITNILGDPHTSVNTNVSEEDIVSSCTVTTPENTLACEGWRLLGCYALWLL